MRFVHIFVKVPDAKRFGVITAAVNGPNMAVSLCSPKDRWNRKIGNRIAHGRLCAGKKFVFYSSIVLDSSKTVRQQVQDAMFMAWSEDVGRKPRWLEKGVIMTRDIDVVDFRKKVVS